MKAVRGRGGQVDVVEVEDAPGSGEPIAVEAVSICASDLMYLRFGCEQIVGHEVSGRREDGTPVVVESVIGCGTCHLCRDGRYHLCPEMSRNALGATADGGMAEQFRCRPDHLIDLPDGISPANASIVEPAAVSWHALRLGNVTEGQRVAVVGAGALGLLAAAGARHMGAGEVAVEARHDFQRRAAERLQVGVGASGEYDVVIDAAGTPESLARAIELAGPGATVPVLGLHHGQVSLDWSMLFHREIRLVPSLGYCSHGGHAEMAEAAAMVAGDPEIAAAIITHRFGIDDAVEAFRVAADRSAEALRVVVEP